MFKTIIKATLALFLISTFANAAVESTTIKNLIEKSDSYNEKVVEAKGQVVKVSKAIMQTDWIHVEDKDGNKVIFRSTSHDVNIGDTVHAKGTVNANVDYGYGYSYKVIVVDSTFKKN